MSILCYHSVQPRWSSPLAVRPEDFGRHCSWLARHRQVLPLRDAVARLNSAGQLPRGTAALTFDDGFAALRDYAMPLLLRYRLPATVFLVAQTLTPAGLPVDWVDTPGPEPLTTLTRGQVLEMQDGGIDFASHSFAHLDLTTLSFAECITDLRNSREVLEDLLGRPVRLLAYPRGRHNSRVRDAAARAGYAHAFALPERAEPAGSYAIPRVGVYRGNSTATVRIKASRPYLRVRTDRAFTLVRRALGRAARAARPSGVAR